MLWNAQDHYNQQKDEVDQHNTLPAAAAKLTLTKRSEKKVLGGLDLNNDSASSVNNYENGITSKSNNGSSALNNGTSKFLSIGLRSSLDLDTSGRSDVTNGSVGAPTVSQDHQESNNGSNNFGEIGSSQNIAWSNGPDLHDSGIGHSPPFDSNNMGN